MYRTAIKIKAYELEEAICEIVARPNKKIAPKQSVLREIKSFLTSSFLWLNATIVFLSLHISKRSQKYEPANIAAMGSSVNKANHENNFNLKTKIHAITPDPRRVA